MTCDDLLERLVDPASSSQGGHAAVVEHLQGCDKCRAATKAFGAVERLYKSEPAGPPPEEFDRRVLDRIATIGTRPGDGLRISPFALGLAAAVTLVVAYFVFRPSTAPMAAASTAAGKKAAPAAAETVPPILAVNSAPLSIANLPPLSADEKARASALFDTEFLRSIETLASLDPFFPEDVTVTGFAGPPAPRPTAAAARPPEKEEKLDDRLADWRRLSAAERKRLVELDAAFRARPEDERAELLSRWGAVRGMTEEEQAATRRLAARIAEFDAKRLVALKSEVRKMATLPKDQRLEAFRKTAFAQTLTGQESAAAEKLLAS
ncbi:MAG TPA: DUF3106 domain-containing protein [Thermoanaerobaculia bacterium]|nr:DUF3106 domain-containing protein [Thermoanaerobaculia bacterium]